MEKPDRSIIKALSLVSQLGISMLTPIFLCAFIGYKLDQWLGTGFWFLIFIVLGICSAFRNVYYLTKEFYTKNKGKDQLVNDYIKELKQSKSRKETMYQDKESKDEEDE